MSMLDRSRALAVAFDPDIASGTKGIGWTTVGLVASDVREMATVVQYSITSLTLAEWASIVAITYGLICIVIALPKLCGTVSGFFRKKS